LNIGHFLVGEAIFTGLEVAVRRMRQLMDAAMTGRDLPGISRRPAPGRTGPS
jgi:pyridoxine 5-phosphate synthase